MSYDANACPEVLPLNPVATSLFVLTMVVETIHHNRHSVSYNAFLAIPILGSLMWIEVFFGITSWVQLGMKALEHNARTNSIHAQANITLVSDNHMIRFLAEEGKRCTLGGILTGTYYTLQHYMHTSYRLIHIIYRSICIVLYVWAPLGPLGSWPFNTYKRYYNTYNGRMIRKTGCILLMVGLIIYTIGLVIYKTTYT